MPRRASSIAIVRLALMAVLMLGIFLPPAFAAVCDIEDVQVALDQGTGAAAAAAADPTDASKGNSVCCANPACGDKHLPHRACGTCGQYGGRSNRRQVL